MKINKHINNCEKKIHKYINLFLFKDINPNELEKKILNTFSILKVEIAEEFFMMAEEIEK